MEIIPSHGSKKNHLSPPRHDGFLVASWIQGRILVASWILWSFKNKKEVEVYVFEITQLVIHPSLSSYLRGLWPNKVVSDNGANYQEAGHLLEGWFFGLWWTLCAAHCVNLMMEEVGGIKKIQGSPWKCKKNNYIHLQAWSDTRLHEGKDWSKGTCKS